MSKLLGFGAGYGFVRGVVKTHKALVYDYDQDYKKYTRPILTVERICAVSLSTVYGLGCTPFFMLKDLYDAEHSMRGYKSSKSEANSVFGLIMW